MIRGIKEHPEAIEIALEPLKLFFFRLPGFLYNVTDTLEAICGELTCSLGKGRGRPVGPGGFYDTS